MVIRFINWQVDSNDSNNYNSFAIIQQWWTDLNGKDVYLLVQEDITLTSNVVSKIPQRFSVVNPRKMINFIGVRLVLETTLVSG